MRTVAGELALDADSIKGARFCVALWPVDPATAAADAKATLATMRARHPDAAHHGYAWRSGPVPADFGWSDGGEPIGTAGKSILQRIDYMGVLNALVIVARYPGPQKLSTSDLAKGYGDAARMALAAATIVPFVPTTRAALTFDYGVSGPVQGVLAAHGAIHEGADYGELVTLRVRVPSERLAALEAGLRDVSSGRVKIEIL